MADERSYTAVEHAAILETQVANKTADLRAAREGLESEKSELQTSVAGLQKEKADLLTQIDKVEAEKAAAEKAKADTDAEFATFKAELARKEEVAKLRTERTDKVKAELAGVGDEYFTEERTQRWAEMSAEQFDAVLADLKETAGALKKKKKDDTKSGVDPEEPDDDDKTQKAARETAAFKGGVEPTAETGTTFMQLMAARRSA